MYWGKSLCWGFLTCGVYRRRFLFGGAVDAVDRVLCWGTRDVAVGVEGVHFVDVTTQIIVLPRWV